MILGLSFNAVYAKNFIDKNFFIKKEYIARNCYTHFDDSGLKDEYQNDVYATAYELASKNQYRNIADVGCGSGYKLLKYFGHCNIVGFEIQPTLNFLRHTYPFYAWFLSDFSCQPIYNNFDIIICADVIEHIVNPDELLNWINEFDFKYFVISTPDRDQLIHVWTDNVYGPQTQSGPPVNIAHVREWSFNEFEKYIGQYFEIVDHFHCQNEFYGQIIVATKKSG
jgi:SAM-dependent methyltransferase